MRIERTAAEPQNQCRKRPALPTVVLGALLLLTSWEATPLRAENVPAYQIRPRDPAASARTIAAPIPATGKYWVFFTDKQIFDSETCGEALAVVASQLAPHAANRRAKAMPDGPSDFHDLPIPQAYLEAVIRTGARVERQSRWLNAVSVRGSRSELGACANLNFVSQILPVRGTRQHGRRDDLVVSPASPPAAGGENPPNMGADPFDYGPSRPQLDQINVIRAHQDGLSGSGVIVGVFDTGFQHQHPAFAEIVGDGRLLAQYDFVKDDGETQNEAGDHPNQHDHGTFTWSTLGGFFESELVGPAYGASFLLAKTEDLESETPIEEDNWVAAAEWADQLSADVISTSLSYIDWYTYEDMDGDTAPITRAADIAASRGIVVCASAGNQGGVDWYYIGAPADADSIITVGAVDADGVLAEFSSHGPTSDGRTKPEVVALGIRTHCAVPVEWGISFADVSGTSLSCPLVGGAVALLIEAHPGWPPMAVRQALLDTADNADLPDNDRGWGLIDTWNAITAPTEIPGADLTNPHVLLVSPNPTASARGTWLHGLTAKRGAPTSVEIFDIEGRRIRHLESGGGATPVFWDGQSEAGEAVAPGLYFARWRSGDWQASTKITVEG